MEAVDNLLEGDLFGVFFVLEGEPGVELAGLHLAVDLDVGGSNR